MFSWKACDGLLSLRLDPWGFAFEKTRWHFFAVDPLLLGCHWILDIVPNMTGDSLSVLAWQSSLQGDKHYKIYQISQGLFYCPLQIEVGPLCHNCYHYTSLGLTIYNHIFKLTEWWLFHFSIKAKHTNYNPFYNKFFPLKTINNALFFKSLCPDAEASAWGLFTRDLLEEIQFHCL